MVHLVCNYKIDHVLHLMTVQFLAAFNIAGAIHVTVVHLVSSNTVLKDDCRTVVVDGLHRRRLLELARDEDHLTWDAEALRMVYRSPTSENIITSAEEVSLSKTVSI